jgi:hypothetical protein
MADQHVRCQTVPQGSKTAQLLDEHQAVTIAEVTGLPELVTALDAR